MKKKVIVLGKLPPPYFGPAIATEIILKSALKKEFDLVHIDTRLNTSLQTMGVFNFNKLRKTLKIYERYVVNLSGSGNSLVLVPIAQHTGALIKDSVFILFALIFRKKVVLHLRGSALLNWFEKQNFLIKSFFRQIFSMSSGAIVLGSNLRYLFEKFLPLDKIFVVPNGADYTFPPRSVKAHHKKIVLLYFANLQSSKGIEDVLKALSFLDPEEQQQIYLNVVGKWRDEQVKNFCLNFVESNNLPCTFHNPKSGKEKFQTFIDSDVFVFPPREPEGHPWVIIEAMAAGLPIITTDQGAITESVVDGENGFIVEPNSPGEIAEKIKIFIKDRECSNSMGHKSRQRYLNAFTEEIMVKNLTKVFNTLLS